MHSGVISVVVSAQPSKPSQPIEEADEEVDVFWQAVWESDSDRLHELHDKLKK